MPKTTTLPVISERVRGCCVPLAHPLPDRTVDDLWGFCRSCYYAEECLAGCTWTSHVFFGRPGNNPYCHHRALEMQANGKRERLVQTQLASGAPFDYSHFEIVVEDAPLGVALEGIGD